MGSVREVLRGMSSEKLGKRQDFAVAVVAVFSLLSLLRTGCVQTEMK